MVLRPCTAHDEAVPSIAEVPEALSGPHDAPCVHSSGCFVVCSDEVPCEGIGDILVETLFDDEDGFDDDDVYDDDDDDPCYDDDEEYEARSVASLEIAVPHILFAAGNDAGRVALDYFSELCAHISLHYAVSCCAADSVAAAAQGACDVGISYAAWRILRG